MYKFLGRLSHHYHFLLPLRSLTQLVHHCHTRQQILDLLGQNLQHEKLHGHTPTMIHSDFQPQTFDLSFFQLNQNFQDELILLSPVETHKLKHIRAFFITIIANDHVRVSL